MKLITRNTDYAVRALCFIAENKDKKIPARDLVKKIKMPRPFLRKILQILQKNGILNSFKGNTGGFTLAIPTEKIFLVDIIEIFQGPLKLNECIFRKRICPDKGICMLRKRVDDIERNVLSELKSITITSLL